MKKIFYALVAWAGMLFAGSCTNESGLDQAVTDQPVQVSFNVGLENVLSTRAVADGTGANILYYQAFLNGEAVGEPETTEIVSKAATATLTLLSGQTYKIAFWAQNSSCDAYDVSDLSAVRVSYEGALNNDETRDAFCAVQEITVGNNANQAVTLKRPFAQLNVGAQEYDHLGITKSQMVVSANSIYSQYNILTGEPSELVAEEVTFAAADVLTDTHLTVAENDYAYLSMSYLLAKQELTNLSFAFYDETDKTVLTLDVENVPIESNNRTNLLGNVSKEDVEFEIVIDSDLDNDKDHDNQPFEEPSAAASLSIPTLDSNGYLPVAFGSDYESLNDVPVQVGAVIEMTTPVDEDVVFNISATSSQPEECLQYNSTVTLPAGQTSVAVPFTFVNRNQLQEEFSTITISTESQKVQLGTTSKTFCIANNFSIPVTLTAANFTCPFDGSVEEEGNGLGALCDNDPGTFLGTFYWQREEFTTYATEIATYGVYVDVTLPVQVAGIKFKYQNRDGNGKPRALKIGAEINGEYQVIGEKTDGFNTNNSAWNETVRIGVGSYTNKFRFGVTKSEVEGEPKDLIEAPEGSMTLAELQVEVMY